MFALMENYAGFATSPESGTEEDAFALTVGVGVTPSYTEELRQEDEGQTIVCGKTVDGQPVYEFGWFGETAGCLICSKDNREGRLIITSNTPEIVLDSALRLMFDLATAEKDTLCIHAAVVSCGGKSYLFLGPSGTGKSTHAGLWLKYIEGAELVNDDNPVVRDGVVYGSPWSGKTPCYRNVSYPLGGIVMLSQAPYNKIERLGGLQAYASLVASISGQRWDARIADGLHQTENALATNVSVWHLECLPDEAAARLCEKTVNSE